MVRYTGIVGRSRSAPRKGMLPKMARSIAGKKLPPVPANLEPNETLRLKG